MSLMVSETNQAMLERSMRSVFVGNIPFDLTEERLKEIFSEVGPVLSFKLVYDRESGKPKGYGFCEYKDIEMANCAMRNLNGYEIGGRILKVDNAANEKSRLEMQNVGVISPTTDVLQGIDTTAPPINNFDDIDAEKAPEAISRAVASLPPEQMFELMKQMKQCIQNNPTEARNMLLTNPQLAYALLQAQVVLRLVDPHTAVAMLHKSNVVPDLTQPDPKPPMPRTDYVPQQPVKVPVESAERQLDPRMMRNVQMGPMGDVDLRGPVMPPLQNQPFPMAPGPEPIPRDPRQQVMPGPPMPVPMPVAPPRDPRATIPGAASNIPVGAAPPLPRQPPPSSGIAAAAAARSTLGLAQNLGGSGASDQEKAALIVQVLQLSDEQIAMLPPEQRQSILVLKEQIAKSAQHQPR